MAREGIDPETGDSPAEGTEAAKRSQVNPRVGNIK
jgi:hypothetical protein